MIISHIQKHDCNLATNSLITFRKNDIEVSIITTILLMPQSDCWI